ncbi:hypothetical protein SynRS9907_02132 [Synechococcus sp. RS9907]|nr:hypothetical protein SynRS9907_02132 [Synechococcus sp. RS9907]
MNWQPTVLDISLFTKKHLFDSSRCFLIDAEDQSFLFRAGRGKSP